MTSMRSSVGRLLVAFIMVARSAGFALTSPHVSRPSRLVSLDAAATTASADPRVCTTISLTKPLRIRLEELRPGFPGARIVSGADVAPNSILLRVGDVDATSLPFREVVELIASTESANVELTFKGPAEVLGSGTKKKSIKSVALPWLPCPPVLATEEAQMLAGNVGFDPLMLAKDAPALAQYRDAEVKHGRLAMVAAFGWVAAELWDDDIAAAFKIPSVLQENNGLNPSLLDGGLELPPVAYWAAVAAFTAWVENVGEKCKRDSLVRDGTYLAGDLGFDPLGLYPTDAEGKAEMQLAELKHGRLAMLAITSFALDEFVFQTPVVNPVA